MDILEDEKDRASQIFLQWFLLEQVEEEETVAAVVDRLKMLQAHPAGMLMLDKELGERQVAPAGANDEA
jgi:ferritin